MPTPPQFAYPAQIECLKAEAVRFVQPNPFRLNQVVTPRKNSTSLFPPPHGAPCIVVAAGGDRVVVICDYREDRGVARYCFDHWDLEPFSLPPDEDASASAAPKEESFYDRVEKTCAVVGRALTKAHPPATAESVDAVASVIYETYGRAFIDLPLWSEIDPLNDGEVAMQEEARMAAALALDYAREHLRFPSDKAPDALADWFERRDELRVGQVFLTELGNYARLAGTKDPRRTDWYVQFWVKGAWLETLVALPLTSLDTRMPAGFTPPNT